MTSCGCYLHACVSHANNPPPPPASSTAFLSRVAAMCDNCASRCLRSSQGNTVDIVVTLHVAASSALSKQQQGNSEGNMKAEDATSDRDLCPVICHEGSTSPHLSENFAV